MTKRLLEARKVTAAYHTPDGREVKAVDNVSLFVNEGEIDPSRLTAVLHYDGTPITARFITEAVTRLMSERRPMPEAAE